MKEGRKRDEKSSYTNLTTGEARTGEREDVGGNRVPEGGMGDRRHADRQVDRASAREMIDRTDLHTTRDTLDSVGNEPELGEIM